MKIEIDTTLKTLTICETCSVTELKKLIEDFNLEDYTITVKANYTIFQPYYNNTPSFGIRTPGTDFSKLF